MSVVLNRLPSVGGGRLHRLLFRPRYKPTVFRSLPYVPCELLFPQPRKPFRTLHTTGDIDARYIFERPLSYGCEGETSIYTDTSLGGAPPSNQVVIKTFHTNTRTNPLPEHLIPGFDTESWPSEIPATLYFANSRCPAAFSAGDDKCRTGAGFMYATDYFVISTPNGKEWRLVTPYTEKGTLEILAALLKHRGMRPGVLDRIYRSRFRGILEALHEMHDAGYCHDDVKMENIFVSSTNAFLLGDLGNVREHNHEFHTNVDPSAFRRADAERAVCSYMAFLRAASGEIGWFDAAFEKRDEEWSRFYWRYRERKVPMTTGELLREEEFWAEEKAGTMKEREGFERDVDEMRKQVREWKAGGTRPGWWKDDEVESGNTWWGGGGRRSAVERELKCADVGFMEKLMMPGASKAKSGTKA